MVFKYISKSESHFLRAFTGKIMQKVQHILRRQLSFEYLLFYGGGSSLLIKDSKSGYVDCEFQILITEALKDQWENPQLIKESLREALNRAVKGVNFFEISDSSFIFSAAISNRKGRKYTDIKISLIFDEGNEGYSRLIYDRFTNRYTLVKVDGSNDIEEKIAYLKKLKKWDLFRKRYLEKRQEVTIGPLYSASDLFLELLNELYDEEKNNNEFKQSL